MISAQRVHIILTELQNEVITRFLATKLNIQHNLLDIPLFVLQVFVNFLLPHTGKMLNNGCYTIVKLFSPSSKNFLQRQ